MLPGEIDSDTISARERSILQGLGRDPKRVGRLAREAGSDAEDRPGVLLQACGIRVACISPPPAG